MRRIPEAHPFVMPEWQRVWWAHFGTGRLSVLPLRDGADPVAVVPVHRDDAGVVRFLGGVDVTDYPGPAIAPGHARDAARHLLDRLTADTSWAELDVRNARPEDGFVPALAAAAATAGLRTSHCADEPIALLDLPATWDEYLARLTRHARHELQRRRRRFARALGEGHVRTADAETLPRDLDTFFALFRRARGEKGGFMTPPMERFFRDVANAFLPLGMLRLDVLEAGGRAVAVAFGFRTRSVYHLYNMAFDPDVQAASPAPCWSERSSSRPSGTSSPGSTSCAGSSATSSSSAPPARTSAACGVSGGLSAVAPVPRRASSRIAAADPGSRATNERLTPWVDSIVTD